MTQQQDLAAAITGKSDEEISAVIEEQGTDTVLAQIFEGMKAAFLPNVAAGQSAVIQWDVGTKGGTRSWQLNVAGGKCDVAEGSPDTASVTMVIGLPDFLRLLTREVDGMTAFMTGKLVVNGDVMLATMMQSWFDQSAAPAASV